MRSYPALFAAAALVALSAPAGAASEAARRHFESAMRALASNDPARMAVELERAIELEPAYIEAHREYQDHAPPRDRAARTAREARYRRLVEANPSSPAFHYLLGRMLEGPEAEAALRRSVELDPGFFWGHLGLADALGGHAAQRAAALDAALRLCPAAPEPQAYLGVSLFRAGRLDEAMRQIERARGPGLNPHLVEIVDSAAKRIPGLRRLHVLSLLAYLVAALICSVALAWLLKWVIVKKALARADRTGLLAILLCTVWFTLWLVVAVRQNPWVGNSFTLPQFLLQLCNAFWPAFIYHAYLVARPAPAPRFLRIARAYFFFSGLVMSVLVVRGFFAYRGLLFERSGRSMQWANLLFLSNFILCTLLIVISSIREHLARRTAREDPEVRAVRRWQIALWGVWLFVFWPLVIAAGTGLVSLAEIGSYLPFLGTLMPLPFFLVGLYYQARYLFLDLVIKKTTVAAVNSAAAAAYFLLVIRPLAGEPGQGLELAPILLLVPLIVSVPALARGVERAVDRLVFNRSSSPAESLAAFSRAIRGVSREQDLLEAARGQVAAMFSTSRVEVFFDPAGSDAALPAPELAEELRATLLAANLRNPRAAELCRANLYQVLVPLRVGGRLAGCVVLGRRQHREPYLSEDVRLLDSLGDQLEIALEKSTGPTTRFPRSNRSPTPTYSCGRIASTS